MFAALAACSPKPMVPAPIHNPNGLAADAYAPRGWTWSPISSVAPYRRYGVGSPPRVPRAEVLILPERSPAEAWFPVANALMGRGYTVWLADAQPGPLRTAAAQAMVRDVIRRGASGRLMVLGEGRGAVAALTVAGKAHAVVLWSPVVGSPPFLVPRWEAWTMRTLGLGGLKLLGQSGRRAGDPGGDPLAQAWMRANPFLRPAPPTYASLGGYESDMRLAVSGAAGRLKGVMIRATGGDPSANALCASLADCRPIAPGVEPMIAVFDEATKEVSLGAPPPPAGKKRPVPAA